MKYLCFCHYDDYRRIQKNEARIILRSNKSFSLEEVMEYYNIPPSEVRKFLLSNSMNFTSKERATWRRLEREEGNKRRENVADLTQTNNWMNVDSIPIGLICAMYDVSKEEVKGRFLFDVEEIKRAKEDLQKKIDLYYNTREQIEYSDLRGIDLVAMRYYRGISRKKLSKLMVVSVEEIAGYEKSKRVTKKVAETYKSLLKISNRHIIQLRLIMKGEATEVKDDRTIPKTVKVLIWSRDEGKCRRCDNKEKLHYHHIIRYADGGQNTKDNLMLLCASCHAEEHKGERSYYMLKKMAEE